MFYCKENKIQSTQQKSPQSIEESLFLFIFSKKKCSCALFFKIKTKIFFPSHIMKNDEEEEEEKMKISLRPNEFAQAWNFILCVCVFAKIVKFYIKQNHSSILLLFFLLNYLFSSSLISK